MSSLYVYQCTRRADSDGDGDGMTIVFTRPPRRNGGRLDRARGHLLSPHTCTIFSYLAPAFKFAPPPAAAALDFARSSQIRFSNDSRATARA